MPFQHRAGDWLKQAQNDLKYAKAALRDGFYAQTCFTCQQASAKSLKAILYARGAKMVLSHSLHKLCGELAISNELLDAARILDQYYITARYPDALVEGTPAEVFTKEQAEQAVSFAEAFLKTSQGSVK